MSKFNIRKHWWILIVAFIVLSVATINITERLMSNYQVVGILLAFGLMGIGFWRVYAIDKDRFWWAIILSLLEFTFLASQLVEHFIGTYPENEWISVLVLGIGAAITGAVVKHKVARLVLILASLITFLAAFGIAPFTPELKRVLIIVDILMAVLFLWRNRSTLVVSH